MVQSTLFIIGNVYRLSVFVIWMRPNGRGIKGTVNAASLAW